MWGKWTQTKRYEKLPTSVKTSAGTPLAIKIVQSCFNKPAKERFTTFISPKYIVSSLKLLKILLQCIISLWNSFTVSILKFNTFLSISTSTRYQSVGYTYHTGTWSADRPWPVAGECWGTQGIAPATTLGRSGYYIFIFSNIAWIYMYCKPSFIHVGKKFQVHRNLITVNMF